jgi:TolB-like protein/AraC-like DNA-binding protein/Tfp pilus assembly protein PilF
MAPNSNEKEAFLKKLSEAVQASISKEHFGVHELSAILGMSRSTLQRKVRTHAGRSVTGYIRAIRLEAAMDLLKGSPKSISEICFETGFSSTSYFTRCFKDYYGITPTVARGQAGEGENRKTGQGKKKIPIVYFLAGIILLLLAIVVLIFWVPGDRRSDPLEKSIAILPFINDSPDQSEVYFINGTMEAILNDLCKIEDLRVVSRTTAEQYRDHPKPVQAIARELGVSYILEGSGQVYGRQMHLTVQLLDARHDSHIWSEEYELEIHQIEDLFDLQREVAGKVVEKIHAEVRPEEKQRMEKIPTTSEMAYEFYLKGWEEGAKFWAGDGSSDLLSSAEALYRYALEYDPDYAAPYRQIAHIYYVRLLTTPSNQAYRDSIEMNLDRALRCDPEDADSYELLGAYNNNQGNWNRAIESFSLALKYHPNSRNIYATMGEMYVAQNDFINALENLRTALSFPQPEYSHINVTETIMRVFLRTGCKEQYDYFAKTTLDYTGDSARYYCDLAIAEYWMDNNIPVALELLEKSYRVDSAALETLRTLGEVCLNDGQNARSLEYYKKYLKRLDELDRVDLYSTHVIGMAYWLNGDQEKADHYFDLEISYCEDVLSGFPDSHNQLASIYAFRGNRDLAYRHLHAFNEQAGMSIYVKNGFRDNNLFFKSLQDEAEYRSIRSEILAKYQAGHERVVKWLEEYEKSNQASR